MTTTAQYASLPKNGGAQVSVANANRDGTGAVGVVLTAGASGARIDALAVKATGTTTAGMLRFFLAKGRAGGAIATMTFVGTTATVTTELAHGLTTGDLVTVQGALPDDYNVVDAAVTVTGALTYTFVMATTPTTAATVVGSFSTSVAVPVTRLYREIAVTAAVPSAIVATFETYMMTGNAVDKGFMPLILQPGWSLRVATEKAETFNITPTVAGGF